MTGRFDGGRLSSDAGGVVLREVDKRIGLTPRLARCFVDYRNRLSVEHDVHALVSQRIYAIALGYEDLNDHGQLRGDALVSLLVGKRDLTGEKRKRQSDRGYALASASTLNRLELGEPEDAAQHRYKRIVSRPEALDDLLVELDRSRASFVAHRWPSARRRGYRSPTPRFAQRNDLKPPRKTPIPSYMGS